MTAMLALYFTTTLGKLNRSKVPATKVEVMETCAKQNLLAITERERERERERANTSFNNRNKIILKSLT